jgi:hypothetical protein
MPQGGRKVIPPRSETAYEIFNVHRGGAGKQPKLLPYFTDVDTCDDCSKKGPRL